MSGKDGFTEDEEIVYQSANEKVATANSASATSAKANSKQSAAPKQTQKPSLKETLAKKYATATVAAVVENAFGGEDADPNPPEMSEQTYQNSVSAFKLKLLRAGVRYMEYTWMFLLPYTLAYVWPDTLIHVVMLEIFSTLGYLVAKKLLSSYAPISQSIRFLVAGLVTTNLCDLGIGFALWILVTAAEREDDGEALEFRGSLSLGMFFGLLLLRLGTRIGGSLEEWAQDQLIYMLPIGQSSNIQEHIRHVETASLVASFLLSGILLWLNMSFGVIVCTVLGVMIPLARFLSLQSALDGLSEHVAHQTLVPDLQGKETIASVWKHIHARQQKLHFMTHLALLVTTLTLPNSPLLLAYLSVADVNPVVIAIMGVLAALLHEVAQIPILHNALSIRIAAFLMYAPIFASALVFLLEPSNYNIAFAVLVALAALGQSALLRTSSLYLQLSSVWIDRFHRYVPWFTLLLALPFATPDSFAVTVWASCVLSSIAVLSILLRGATNAPSSTINAAAVNDVSDDG
eukprot:TRINITY_DN7096_c0_g1_i1.p1 TRINITY_DN7096_c0_g1~~TRINITY_DN7096_c0_g1_i1.p1  ORF type:complete len:518 (+),score=112.95 TRINITY_DN7096_c0_g1_i1:59-1612(+)